MISLSRWAEPAGGDRDVCQHFVGVQCGSPQVAHAAVFDLEPAGAAPDLLAVAVAASAASPACPSLIWCGCRDADGTVSPALRRRMDLAAVRLRDTVGAVAGSL